MPAGSSRPRTDQEVRRRSTTASERAPRRRTARGSIRPYASVCTGVAPGLHVSPTSVRSLRPTIRSPYTSRPDCAPAHRGVRTAADSPESIYAWTALPPVHLDASAPNQPLYCRPRRRSFFFARTRKNSSGARTGPAPGRAGPHPSIHATKTWRSSSAPRCARQAAYPGLDAGCEPAQPVRVVHRGLRLRRRPGRGPRCACSPPPRASAT
jgi:hypothetical protein